MATDIQPLAVLIAAIAGFAAGGAWYNFFGRRWQAAASRGPTGTRPDPRKLQRARFPLIVAFLADLLMALVLAFILPTGAWEIGATAGAVVWLGFVLPTTTVNYAFQSRPLTLTLIDAGHWLLVLVLMGGVLGIMSGQ
jgi:hypothetical protein